MKRSIIIFAVYLFILSACNNPAENSAATKTSTGSESPAVVTEKPVIEYSYQIQYKDWELGNPANTNTALAFYKAWDENQPSKLADLFADTIRMRIPEEKKEIIMPKDKINEMLGQNMSEYKTSSNKIISAVSLHDKESGEDWVMITTYAKWVEKNGKRDSLIYHDDWRLKNGKLDFLMSFDKVPTRQFLLRNDPQNK